MTFVRACSRAVAAASISLILASSALAGPPKPPKGEATQAGNGAVKTPIFSTDSCKKDADCAPIAMCHPDKCVALANAGAGGPPLICTMECRGNTLDCGYNHCGCAASSSGKKVCAVLPGAK
jgi:hypothetical protein